VKMRIELRSMRTRGENDSVARRHHEKRVLSKTHQEWLSIVEQGGSCDSNSPENISKFLGEPVWSIYRFSVMR